MLLVLGYGTSCVSRRHFNHSSSLQFGEGRFSDWSDIMLAVFILGAAHGGRVITRIRPILLYIDGVAKRLLIFFSLYSCMYQMNFIPIRRKPCVASFIDVGGRLMLRPVTVTALRIVGWICRTRCRIGRRSHR